MNGKVSNNKDYRPLHEYSCAQEFVNNVPYIAMTVLGAAIFAVGFEDPVWGWITGSAYVIYSVAGAFWIMIFLCPYCPRWNSRACPCGYGRIAAKLREKKGGDHFKEKFKKHIPVIVPLWFVPILFGAAVVARSFSWPLLVLLVVFALDAFIVLPLFSKKHGCADCPQRDSCPWMGCKGE